MGGWTVKVLFVLAKNDDNDGSNGNGRGIGENKMVMGDASCAWTRNVMSSACRQGGRGPGQRGGVASPGGADAWAGGMMAPRDAELL